MQTHQNCKLRATPKALSSPSSNRNLANQVQKMISNRIAIWVAILSGWPNLATEHGLPIVGPAFL